MNRKILLMLAVMSVPAFAQTPAAPPAPGATAPAAPPPQVPPLPPEKTVSLDLALDAVQTALNSCKASNSLAVVELVDLNGNIKVLLAADGVRTGLYDFARRKAYTVIKKGMSSGDFGKQVGPQVRGGPPIEGDPNLVTAGGGLPIMRGGNLIGALAVSGPTGAAADTVCAQAGLDKIKDRL